MKKGHRLWAIPMTPRLDRLKPPPVDTNLPVAAALKVSSSQPIRLQPEWTGRSSRSIFSFILPHTLHDFPSGFTNRLSFADRILHGRRGQAPAQGRLVPRTNAILLKLVEIRQSMSRSGACRVATHWAEFVAASLGALE